MGDKTSARVYLAYLHTGGIINRADISDSDMVIIDRRPWQTVTPIVPSAQFQVTIPLKGEDGIKLKKIIEREKEMIEREKEIAKWA
nr:MAG TPA: hypothetical protein [Caudoviricetes sp.]